MVSLMELLHVLSAGATFTYGVEPAQLERHLDSPYDVLVNIRSARSLRRLRPTESLGLRETITSVCWGACHSDK